MTPLGTINTVPHKHDNGYEGTKNGFNPLYASYPLSLCVKLFLHRLNLFIHVINNFATDDCRINNNPPIENYYIGIFPWRQ